MEVKLYICEQGVEHFKKRKKYVEEVLECYKQYLMKHYKSIGRTNEPRKNIEWKLSIKDVLVYFLRMDIEFTNREAGQICQNDRPLSAERFKRCVEQVELAYEMEVKSIRGKNSETLYTISKEYTNQEEKSCNHNRQEF